MWWDKPIPPLYPNGNGILDNGDTISVITTGHSAYTFDVVDGKYRPRDFIQDKLSVENSFFVFTDTTGAKFRFFDFEQKPSHRRGRLA